MNQEFLSTREAAKLLGVGPSTIKRWTEDGRLLCIKTSGGHRRFRRSDVLALRSRPVASTGRQPLSSLSREELDDLDFGVIGFHDDATVFAYNRAESEFTGFDRPTVLGMKMFAELAPCSNNSLVRARYENAQRSNTALNHTIDYVFTYRMRPTPVRIEMIREVETRTNWMLVYPTP